MATPTAASGGGGDGRWSQVAAVDNQVPAGGPTESRGGGGAWPIRSGAVPPLANGFIPRPESAPALEAERWPGAAVGLVRGWGGAKASRDWLWPCCKTQIAVSFAEWFWQS